MDKYKVVKREVKELQAQAAKNEEARAVTRTRALRTHAGAALQCTTLVCRGMPALLDAARLFLRLRFCGGRRRPRQPATAAPLAAATTTGRTL